MFYFIEYLIHFNNIDILHKYIIMCLINRLSNAQENEQNALTKNKII